MSVRVEHLTKMYGEQKAIDNISFEVKPGEVLGFLGPNGAGKSTTMKILSGFIPQTEGKAFVCDFDVEKDSLKARSKVGYLPENNPLYTDMYVKEFLLFVAGLNGIKHKQRKSRMEEMLEVTGLKSEMNKKIGALSKGYRQRVGLAQALIHDPEVLILDEPTSGLDPNQLVEIRNLIRELGKEKTVILSTHIMQEVQALCHRVIIINKGKIVANDTAENLQRTTSNEVVVKVSFKESVSEKLLMQIEGVKSARNVGANNFELNSATDIQEKVFRFAVENKLIILSLQQEKQNLEEVFRQLTKS
ncbi:gliding motility-associated ABC transporter ATP-binding subunit GldA [Bacteroidota bacterium]|nr:gliding motility-associated ABC transporter ATP-binding subunit GldA [Bacteroidota bacterium]